MSRQKLLRIAHFSSAHPAALAKSKVTQNADRRNTAGDGMTKTRSGGAAPLKATTLNFSDTATAFRDTPTRDLLRAFFVFHLFRSTSLVKHCTTVSRGVVWHSCRVTITLMFVCVCVCVCVCVRAFNLPICVKHILHHSPLADPKRES